MIKLVEEILEEKVRPSLRAHGGGIEVVDIENFKVYVKLKGGCQGCSSSSATLKNGVEKILKEAIPEIEEVVDLTNHANGKDPYYN